MEKYRVLIDLSVGKTIDAESPTEADTKAREWANSLDDSVKIIHSLVISG